jgi:predicted amidohydrolase
VAICQILSIDGDREGNFRRIEYALAAARGAGAAIAAFPESVILGWENPDAHRLAAPIPGADSDRTAAFGDAYVARIRAFKPDVVLIPYGWAVEMEKWPGHSKSLEDLVVRRAKEWNGPVVAANLVGQMTHAPWKGQTFGGTSLAVDGSGEVLVRLRDRDVDVRVVDLPLGSRAR